MLNRNLKKAGLFVIFSLILSITALVVLFYSGVRVPANTMELLLILGAYSAGPFISTFVVEKLIYNEDPIAGMNINFKFNFWALSALLVPTAILFGAFGIGLLMPGTSYSPDLMGEILRKYGEVNQDAYQQMQYYLAMSKIHPVWMDFFTGIAAGITVIGAVLFLAVASFVGFLFKELLYIRFWKASYLSGLIATLWLYPLVFTLNLYYKEAGLPSQGLEYILLFVVMIFPVLAFFKLKARNVVVPTVIAGITYWGAPVAVKMIFGGNSMTIGITGFAGLIAVCVLSILIFVYNRFLTPAIERIY